MRHAARLFVIPLWMVVQQANGTVHAQAAEVPNFTGTWTVSDQQDTGASPLGRQFTVTQAPGAITLETAGNAVTYQLNDSENTWTTTTVRGETRRRIARARFVSLALLVTTRTEAGTTGTWEDLMMLAPDGKGQLTLVSSSAALYPEGAMNTKVFVYKKQ